MVIQHRNLTIRRRESEQMLPREGSYLHGLINPIDTEADGRKSSKIVACKSPGFSVHILDPGDLHVTSLEGLCSGREKILQASCM
jgi:hypothetical protein